MHVFPFFISSLIFVVVVKINLFFAAPGVSRGAALPTDAPTNAIGSSEKYFRGELIL